MFDDEFDAGLHERNEAMAIFFVMLTLIGLVVCVVFIVKGQSARDPEVKQRYSSTVFWVFAVSMICAVMGMSITASDKTEGAQPGSLAADPSPAEGVSTPTEPPAQSGATHLKQAYVYAGSKEWKKAVTELFDIKPEDPEYKTAQKKIDEYNTAFDYQEQAARNNEIRKAKSSNLRLREVIKAPDDHRGESLSWRGNVMDIAEKDGQTFAQVAYYENGEPTGDNFFVNLEGSSKIFKEDQVIVYGTFSEMKEYTSQANYELRSPMVEAIQMKKSGG